jgi:putative hydrolases of HD superfamily
MPESLAQPVIDLGQLALAFGRVDRATYHEDGVTRESDTDHTVMLGLVACAFAARHLPGLDLGRIAQYGLVHDLVEVYAGDTVTLVVLDAAQREDKHRREHAALERITRELGSLPWVASAIASYEQRADPEARYVKALDKLLPKITHILNGLTTIHELGMTREELALRYEIQDRELCAYVSDFPPLFALRAELVDLVLATPVTGVRGTGVLAAAQTSEVP